MQLQGSKQPAAALARELACSPAQNNSCPPPQKQDALCLLPWKGCKNHPGITPGGANPAGSLRPAWSRDGHGDKVSAGTSFLPGSSYLMETARFPRAASQSSRSRTGKVTCEGPSCFILVLCFCLFKSPRSRLIAGPGGRRDSKLRRQRVPARGGSGWVRDAVGAGDATAAGR